MARRACGSLKRALAAGVVLALVTAVPGIGHAETDVLGPRLEVGLGPGGFGLQDSPLWAGKWYAGAQAVVSLRVLAGLSVQGGTQLGYGWNIGGSDIAYMNAVTVRAKRTAQFDSNWYGLRYEIVAPARMQRYWLTGLWIAGGKMTTDFKGNITSYKATGATPYPEPSGATTFATCDGYYAALGGRWRFLTDETSEENAWIGSYGVDAGVRYVRYDSFDSAHNAVTLPSSPMESVGLYLVGFMKVRLFE